MRINKQGLIGIPIILSGCLVLNACAPVYRFIKGHDPERVMTNTKALLKYTDYMTDKSFQLMEGTLDLMVPGNEARLPGTTGESNSARYAEAILTANGYQTEMQTFPVSYELSKRLNVVDPLNGSVLESLLIPNTGNLPKEGLYDVYDARGGTEDDLLYTRVEDSLILVEKKFRNLEEICREVKTYGGKGILYYSNVEDGLPRDKVTAPFDFPVFSLKYEEAKALTGRLEKKMPVQLKLTGEPVKFTGESSNVVGILGRLDYAKPTILISANLDSKSSPGGNQNASGTAAALQIGEILAQLKPEDTNIMIVLFGASTLDNAGEKVFLQKLEGKLKNTVDLCIGLTTLGKGMTLQVSGSGENDLAEIYATAEGIAEELQYKFKGSEGGSPGNQLFVSAGIPSLEFQLTPDEAAGTARDTLSSVDLARVSDVVNVVLNVIYEADRGN